MSFIAAITAAIAMSAPAVAGAGTQIGQTFVPDVGVGKGTYLQSITPAGEYSAPFSGVITSWSFQAAMDPVLLIRLKVARPTGGNNFTIVGESSFKSPVLDQLNTYTDVRIPVEQGDLLGLYNDTNTGKILRDVAGGYARHVLLDSDPPPGSTNTYLGPSAGSQLDVSAIVEPDCDSDGFGDETQDPDISSCNPPGPKADGTLTIDANKGKVEKGRKVTLTGQLDVAANEGCEPGRAVQIQRRLKSQDDSKFATFKTVTTDAVGNFTLKRKVKKTYFYRAVVRETEACDDETSNTQKVRVQKKKAAQEA